MVFVEGLGGTSSGAQKLKRLGHLGRLGSIGIKRWVFE